MCLHESKRKPSEILIKSKVMLIALKRMTNIKYEAQGTGNTTKPFVIFETPYIKVKFV